MPIVVRIAGHIAPTNGYNDRAEVLVEVNSF
jgi:hypothetical protein